MSETGHAALTSGDVMLWEKYTVKTREGKATIARLVDGVMPDGQSCVAKFEDYKPKDMINLWYNYVKGEYDAREAKQEAEAASRAAAPPPRRPPEDPSPRVDGGGEVPAPPPVPDREGSVEEIVEAKISTLGGLIAEQQRLCEEAARALKLAEDRRDSLKAQRKKAIAALRAMKELP